MRGRKQDFTVRRCGEVTVDGGESYRGGDGGRRTELAGGCRTCSCLQKDVQDRPFTVRSPPEAGVGGFP